MRDQVTWPAFYRHDPHVRRVQRLCDRKVHAVYRNYGYSRCLELPYSVFEDLVKPPSGFQKGCVAEVVFNDPQEMVEQGFLVVNGLVKNVA